MRIILATLCAVAAVAASSESLLGHRASVSIDPASSQLSVVDTLSVGRGETPVSIALNRSLRILPIPGVTVVDPDTTARWDIPQDVARVVRFEATSGRLPEPLVVRYGGTLRHEFEGRGDYARGFETTAGIIDSSGVFLAGSSYWLPAVPDRMMRFRLHVSLPPGWDCVSQGSRSAGPDGTTWRCEDPMEEAYLVAGRFHRFEQPCGNVSAQAYLLSPDTTLARTYLDATCRYLALYDSLIGPYAYEKFALVENFWQTGYGMPSFTLLGSIVIRLPFIVHTSYGHEILHNWFGNGVYVEYERGNWCEGLTAYLADHYYKELAGQDSDYRLRQLQHYRWYTFGRADIPLTQFTERHSSASEAVGYGKSSVVFHMLRRELGDERFFAGIRAFYRDNLFRTATWEDVARAFAGAAGRNVDSFFQQWVHRTGAPFLSLALAEPAPGGVRLAFTQPEPTYAMGIPVEVTADEGDTTVVRAFRLPISGTRLDTVLPVTGVIRRVAIDPAFNVFRILQPGESPPGLGRILGADTLFVVSSSLDSLITASWPTEGVVQVASAPDRSARTLMIAGDSPDIRTMLAPCLGDDIAPAGATLVAGTDSIPLGQTLIAVGEEADVAWCWIRPAAGIDTATLAAVLGKVVHYDSYSMLAFEGTRCVLRQTWWPRSSPMAVEFKDAGRKGS